MKKNFGGFLKEIIISGQMVLDTIFDKVDDFFSDDTAQKLDTDDMDELLIVEDEPGEIFVPEKKKSFNYDLIKNFIEEYIGVPITGVELYIETEFPNDNFAGAIITEVRIEEGGAQLVLSGMGGISCGKIFMPFSPSGQILEKTSDDLPSSNSLYRINFYGGDSIEYSDENQENILIYKG